MLSGEDWMCYSSSHQQVSKGQSIKRPSQLGNGRWSYEWMRNSRFNRAFNPIKAGLIYLFEIGFNTEIHPSSCAFPQFSGQILERAIEGRKGPLSTLQMGSFLLIPTKTSCLHILADISFLWPGVISFQSYPSVDGILIWLHFVHYESTDCSQKRLLVANTKMLIPYQS